MSSLRRAAPLVFPAASKHTATVIFAHGLGDTGAGWADAVEHWRGRARLNEVKFILPNAPVMPITMNHGYQMPAWFDVVSATKGPGLISPLSRRPSLPPFPKPNPAQKKLGVAPEEASLYEDVPGIGVSEAYFHGLIQAEIDQGIPADRIVLGGFSQGGAMSLLAGLTAPVKIGGVIGLSSWLLLNQSFNERLPAGNFNKATPVFMGHGDRDPVVKYELGLASLAKLKKWGFDVTLKTYHGMQHSACLEELNDVEAFLLSRLPQGK